MADKSLFHFRHSSQDTLNMLHKINNYISSKSICSNTGALLSIYLLFLVPISRTSFFFSINLTKHKNLQQLPMFTLTDMLEFGNLLTRNFREEEMHIIIRLSSNIWIWNIWVITWRYMFGVIFSIIENQKYNVQVTQENHLWTACHLIRPGSRSWCTSFTILEQLFDQVLANHLE